MNNLIKVLILIIFANTLVSQDFSVKHYSTNNYLDDSHVLDIGKDNAGLIWISTRKGIYIKQDNAFTLGIDETKNQYIENFEFNHDQIWYSVVQSEVRMIKALDVVTREHVDLTKLLPSERFTILELLDLDINNYVCIIVKDRLNPETNFLYKIDHMKVLGKIEIPITIYDEETYQSNSVYYYVKNNSEYITIDLDRLIIHKHRPTANVDYSFLSDNKLLQEIKTLEPKGLLDIKNPFFKFNGDILQSEARQELQSIKTYKNRFIGFSKYSLLDFHKDSVIVFNNYFRNFKGQAKLLSHFVDDKLIYVGTSIGLYKLSEIKSPFSFYLEGEFIQTRDIIALDDNHLMIATERGIYRINLLNSKIEEYAYKRHRGFGLLPLPDSSILVLRNSNKNYILSNRTKAIIDSMYINESFSLSGVTVGDDIFLGTNRGIEKYNYSNKSTRLVIPFGYPDLICYKIIDLKKDNLLAACTTNGLYLFDILKNKLDLIKDFQGFEVTFMTSDLQNNFWITTRGRGIFKWSPENGILKHYTMQNSNLTHNNVHGAFYDKSKRLWLPTDYGISILDPSEKIMYVINEEDGIIENEFNRYSSFVLKDSTFIFGSINGLCRIDPSKVSFSRPKSLHINSISTFDKKNNLLNEFELIESDRSICISRKVNRVDCTFIDNSDYKGNVRYKLVNQDSQWIYLLDDKFSFIPNKHNLNLIQYEVETEMGHWTESKYLQIKMSIPFFLKPWFLLFCLLIIPFTLFLYSKYAQNKLMKLNRMISQKVQDQSGQLIQINEELSSANDINTQLFAMIGHDLRAPVISLQKSSVFFNHFLSQKNMQSLERVCDEIEKKSIDLQKKIDRLLEWALLSKTANLKKEDIAIKKYLFTITDRFSRTIKRKHLKTNVQIQGDEIISCIPQTLEIVISNILDNAIKYSPKYSEISIRTYKQDGYNIISIVDAGKGVNEDFIDKLIQNDISWSKGTQGESGLGIGLKLCKRLLVKMNCKLRVKANSPKGANFEILIPI